MPHEDLEDVPSAIQAIEKFAGRLPEGDVEGQADRAWSIQEIIGVLHRRVELAA